MLLCPCCDTQMQELIIALDNGQIGVDYECPRCHYECEGDRALC